MYAGLPECGAIQNGSMTGPMAQDHGSVGRYGIEVVSVRMAFLVEKELVIAIAAQPVLRAERSQTRLELRLDFGN